MYYVRRCDDPECSKLIHPKNAIATGTVIGFTCPYCGSQTSGFQCDEITAQNIYRQFEIDLVTAQIAQGKADQYGNKINRGHR